jgi:hypothetical protein
MDSLAVRILLMTLALVLGKTPPSVQATAISLAGSDVMVSATPRAYYDDQLVSDFYFNITDGQLAYSEERSFTAENFGSFASIDWSYNFAFSPHVITATSTVSSRAVASDNGQSGVDGGTSYTLSFTTTQKTKFTMIGSSSVNLEVNVDTGDSNEANTDFGLVGFDDDNWFKSIAGNYSQVHSGSKTSSYFKSGILEPSTYLFRASSYTKNGAIYPDMTASSNTSLEVRLYLETIPEPNTLCLTGLGQFFSCVILGRKLREYKWTTIRTHPR